VRTGNPKKIPKLKKKIPKQFPTLYILYDYWSYQLVDDLFFAQQTFSSLKCRSRFSCPFTSSGWRLVLGRAATADCSTIQRDYGARGLRWVAVDDYKGVHAGSTIIKRFNHETYISGKWWLFDDKFGEYAALDILGIIIINEPGIPFLTYWCNGMTEGIEHCSSVPCRRLKWNCDLSILEPFRQERK
jgi:hypothetical protein